MHPSSAAPTEAQELDVELLRRTAQREFAAVPSSVLGVLLIVVVQWGVTPPWALLAFALLRLGALAHNQVIARQLLATPDPGSLARLTRHLQWGVVAGGVGWGLVPWMLGSLESWRPADLVLIVLPIAASTLMMVTTAHWLRGMLCFLGAMWGMVLARLLLDPAWRQWPLLLGVTVLLLVLALYGRQLHRQTRDGVAAELLARRLSLELGETNAQLSQALSKALHLATRDPLTGLLNRRAMLERLDDLAARLSREARPAGLLLIDMDHFKLINDQHGHALGDEVLLRATAALSLHLRQEDLLSRWGGEEFLVVLPGSSPTEGAAVAERLRAAVAGVSAGADTWPKDLRVSCSIGMTRWLPPQPLAAAIAAADHALYRAKLAGRNRVES